MSGSQQHSPYNPNPSPGLPYRASFSPTEQHHPPLPNPAAHCPNPSILPQQTHQQFTTNGRSGPAVSLPPLTTSAPFITRSGYYDPVESRPSDMSSGWSQSTTSATNIAATTYERGPSTQSQTVCSHFIYLYLFFYLFLRFVNIFFSFDPKFIWGCSSFALFFFPSKPRPDLGELSIFCVSLSFISHWGLGFSQPFSPFLTVLCERAVLFSVYFFSALAWFACGG